MLKGNNDGLLTLSQEHECCSVGLDSYFEPPLNSARSEKRIFQVANKERHPFLTTLHSCFQSDTRLYFVMEYVRGGDLMMHIQRDRRFGERRAKFYGCEVLLALQYFHQNDIVYR